MELAVAARLKRVNIHVFEHCEGRFRCVASFNEPAATRNLSLAYRTEPCRHYDALLMAGAGAQIPSLWPRDASPRASAAWVSAAGASQTPADPRTR